MKVTDLVTIMQSYSSVYPDAEVTFANNKVPVSKIVYDERTNSINLR